MKLISASKIPAQLATLSLLFFSQAALAALDSSGFQPRIEAQVKHEDNVRRTPEQYKQRDSILVLKPDLPLLWDFGKHKLDLIYEGEYAQYTNYEELNYNDHRLGSQLRLDHSLRLNSELTLGHIRGHDIPDDNNVIANPIGVPNQWQENYATAELSYGNVPSQGQIITKLEYKQHDYTNNNLQSLDSKQTGLSGVFYYRIAPKTRIPFELSITNYNYDNTISVIDPSSNSYKLLTGFTWEASAKSTGIFQLGLLEKKYENSLFEDISTPILKLDGVWRPNTYTKLVFGAIRDVEEPVGVNIKANIQNHIHTEITHMATPRTALIFSALFTAAKIDDLIGIKNNRFKAGLEVTYSLLRRLKIGANYKYVERNSGL
ncbi:MAG: outer membrane beta-barrel protein, partial [Proteobacteria bacterium]|nr:outer membrane beta-barrel protein [Pseudomonadota bacterium]